MQILSREEISGGDFEIEHCLVTEKEIVLVIFILFNDTKEAHFLIFLVFFYVKYKWYVVRIHGFWIC